MSKKISCLSKDGRKVITPFGEVMRREQVRFALLRVRQLIELVR